MELRLSKLNVNSPKQCSLNAKTLVKHDFYEKCMLKHPLRSHFTSRFVLLYAALLESKPSVISYVPRPYKIAFQKTFYYPDLYVATKEQRFVVDILPAAMPANGKSSGPSVAEKESLFSAADIAYKVKSTKDIINKQIRAESWLDIVQRLYLAKSIDTDFEYETILSVCGYGQTGTSLYKILQDAIELDPYRAEIALLRLAFDGRLKIDVNKHPFNHHTKVSGK